MNEQIASAASKAMYAGSGGSVIGGFLMSSEVVAFCGLILAAAGFLVNWYYKRKADRREQEAHERRMRSRRSPDKPKSDEV